MDIFGLTSPSLKLAEIGMDQTTRASKLIASNVANYETPGFKAREVDFKSALKAALDSGLARTDARHLPAPFPAGVQPAATLSRAQGTLNGNNVNMEKEMANLAEVQGMYQAYANSAGKELAKLKSAVDLSVG